MEKQLPLVRMKTYLKGVSDKIKAEEKSNEITAIPALLDMLDVAGSIVTIDAMGTQRDIAEKIIKKKADYILSVKQNQPTMYMDIDTFVHEEAKSDFRECAHEYCRTMAKAYSLLTFRYALCKIKCVQQKRRSRKRQITRTFYYTQ